jgi:NADH:ubiquinone oxidoreductase subunit C
VLTVGKATSGSSLTHYSYDYDWYAIDLDAAKRMSLSLTFPSGLGAGDVYDVDVYDMNGRSLYHFDVTGNRSSGAWLADQPVSLSAGRSYVRVYGTNSWNSWGKTYSLTAKYALTKMPVPKVTGTAIVGKTLKAVPGAWAPAKVTLKYQWLRAGKAIKGATKSTYKLVKADAGKRITVKVTGSKSGYASASKTSKAVTALHALTKTPTPKITGTATVGKTLKAVPGTWAPAKVTLKYQWLRAGKAIKGATKSSYKLVSADKGKKVTVKVTGSKKNYKSVAKTSAAKTIR